MACLLPCVCALSFITIYMARPLTLKKGIGQIQFMFCTKIKSSGVKRLKYFMTYKFLRASYLYNPVIKRCKKAFSFNAVF